MSRWNPKANEIFLQSLDEESSEGRQAFLDEACGSDQQLRDEVESLLRGDQQAPSFFERAALAFTIDEEAVSAVGTKIGPYKLREQIGEGGMGVVYVAEQTEPIRRKVALKIVRPGMASQDVVARFGAERQALAMMDHPNIAQVFDGGATDSGRPYFVMELVQGVSITEYFDQQRLSTEDRLKLFVTVCKAVQHAHQKGIIHRDLKPSNIMVAEIDAAAIPKVIDFGVAKAVSHMLTEETLYTHYSQLVGTPLYMSPEQTGLGVLDIDTRSDIYSLGVLLYELLTGNTPFDSDALRQAGFDEMRRIIREDEPLTPSAMVSTLNAEALSTVSQYRGSDPRKLKDSLEGELDWIVMKALEKDRNRRYASADALADDVQRYLRDEPVEAGPPSRFYRARKFLQRRRRAVAIAATLLLLLVAGTVGSTTGWVRASQSEADARRDATSEAQARAQAVRQRQRAKALLGRMQLARGIEKLNTEDARGLLDLIDAWSTADENPDLRAAVGRLWALGQQGAESRLVHVFPASCAAFSPDGKLLATATGRQVQLWDLGTGEAVGEPLQHQRSIDDVLVSPDGARLVTITDQATARLWDVHTHKQVGPPLHHDPVREGHANWNTLLAAFSPDGKLLATGVLDVPVRFWDATTGEPHGKPLRPERELTALAFSPDGQLLATGSEDGVAQLWDVANCEPARQPLRPSRNPRKQGVIKVAFSPDGRLLATAYGDAAAVWETETGREHSLCGVGLFQMHWLLDVAFSPDGGRLATASTDRTARLWDVDSGEAIGTPMHHRGRVNSVTYDAEGNLIATASRDGTVRLWDAHRGEPLGPLFQHAGNVGRVAFSPDGKLLATDNGSDTRIWQVDRSIDRPPMRISSSSRKTALSPDGRYRATITRRSPITRRYTVEVVNTTNATEVIDWSVDDVFITVAFSPDSRLLATSSWGHGTQIWEATTGRLRRTLHCPERVYAVAFCPDGKTLATGLFDGTILLWDYAAGKRIGFPIRHPSHVWHVAFSPGGEMLASITGAEGRPDELWFWDMTTGPDYAGLRAPHLTLAPDELLETFNLDGSLRLAEPNGGRRVWVLPQPPSELHQMRLASWVALGLEYDLQGQVKRISAERWRTLREELNARQQAGAGNHIKPNETTETNPSENTNQGLSDD